MKGENPCRSTASSSPSPAPPGWYIASPVVVGRSDTGEENWDDTLLLRPIIGWEIERYQQPEHSRWDQRVTHDVWPLTSLGGMHCCPAAAIRELKMLYEGDLREGTGA